eukprot:319766-Rhodomonas_salina.2
MRGSARPEKSAGAAKKEMSSRGAAHHACTGMGPHLLCLCSLFFSHAARHQTARGPVGSIS